MLDYLQFAEEVIVEEDDLVLATESNDMKNLRRHDETPLIYLCATMWHETKQEMLQMLKSIFRYYTERPFK